MSARIGRFYAIDGIIHSNMGSDVGDMLVMQKFLIAMLFSLICYHANAMTVNDLYTVRTTVTDSSAEARNHFLPFALDQVLTKVAGAKSILAHHEVAIAKMHLDKYVTSYVYKNNPYGTYNLSIQFSDKMIAELLHKIGHTVLDKNRPLSMAWLVINTDNHSQFVGGGVHEDIAAQLDSLAQVYGIPLARPQLDLAERMIVREQDVLDFHWEPLRLAASKYHPEIIIAGKITEVDGQWHCEWQLSRGAQIETWQTISTDLNPQLDQMMERLATNLALAQLPKPQPVVLVPELKRGITLRVKGITDLAAYAKINNYLNNITAIKRVEVKDIREDEAIFTLLSDGGKESIEKALNAELTLVADSSAVDVETDNLVYKANL